jgi:hypothetical protein
VAKITMIPFDTLVSIDGQAANGINFTGIDPTISAVQWYDTIGQIEYYKDPITSQGQANQNITSLAPFQGFIDQATQIIYARNNPVSFWVTQESGILYDGLDYNFGSEIIVTDVGWPQPAGTTTLEPPIVSGEATLYWYNGTWLESYVDPASTLPEAQQALAATCQASAAEAFDAQASIYSVLQLIQSADPTILPTRDIAGFNLGEYQDYLDNEVGAILTIINSATSVPALYNIDPYVNPIP